MWHTGRPAADQCEGCTFNTGHVLELAYLHSRDVTFAVFCEGPFEESDRYRAFMGWAMPWYAVPDESLDRIAPGGHFGMKACYLRVDDRVFETYWTTGRGCETMGKLLPDARHDRLRAPGGLGGLARGLAAALRLHPRRQRVPPARAADLTVATDRRRPIRRPRLRGRRPHRTPPPLRPPRRRLATIILPGTTHVGMIDRVDWLLPMVAAFLDAPMPAAA
jgi:hypothetical protein